MYEDGIDVVFELRADDESPWSAHRKVHMPGWCAGDVEMALALMFFGQRGATGGVRVTDWQPR